jgi:hypothetical protein
MSDDNMPYRYEEDQQYPIDHPAEELPYDSRGEPMFKVGDLVRWNQEIRDRREMDKESGFQYISPWSENKKYAIVKEAFWALIDWQYSIEDREYYSPRDADFGELEVPFYIPEYVLYWNDGCISNTRQSYLELVSGVLDATE